eukprot:Gb_12331 [translate_table: standard]
MAAVADVLQKFSAVNKKILPVRCEHGPSLLHRLEFGRFCKFRVAHDYSSIKSKWEVGKVNDQRYFNIKNSRRPILLSSLLTSLYLAFSQPGRGYAAIYEGSLDDSFGFDGLGKNVEEYAPAKIVALAQAGDGALLFIGVDGFSAPMRIIMGAPEAMAILSAAQARKSRRPATHEAWGSSLAAVGWKVERMAITSINDGTFYSRLVLSPADATLSNLLSKQQRSVDMRPSDAIALALRCGAPLFVGKEVAQKLARLTTEELDLLNRPDLQASEYGKRYAAQTGFMVLGSWESSFSPR